MTKSHIAKSILSSNTHLRINEKFGIVKEQMWRVLNGPSTLLIGKHYVITKQFTNRYPSPIKH